MVDETDGFGIKTSQTLHKDMQPAVTYTRAGRLWKRRKLFQPVTLSRLQAPRGYNKHFILFSTNFVHEPTQTTDLLFYQRNAMGLSSQSPIHIKDFEYSLYYRI
jgi:hypothetical protein